MTCPTFLILGLSCVFCIVDAIQAETGIGFQHLGIFLFCKTVHEWRMIQFMLSPHPPALICLSDCLAQSCPTPALTRLYPLTLRVLAWSLLSLGHFPAHIGPCWSPSLHSAFKQSPPKLHIWHQIKGNLQSLSPCTCLPSFPPHPGLYSVPIPSLLIQETDHLVSSFWLTLNPSDP